MTSSQRSKLGAIGLFALIALVVIGGMGWATVSSFELAKKTIIDEHNRNVSQAIREMDSYIAGIIYAESARDFNYYRARFDVKPEAAYNEDGSEADVNRVVLKSPLAESGPRHDWIDLYFLLDSRGVLSSPHITEDQLLLDDRALESLSEPKRRMLQTWKWLPTALSKIDLRDSIAQACGAEHDGVLAPNEDSQSATDDASEHPTENTEVARDSAPSQAQHGRSLRKQQENYLPGVACLDPEIAEKTAARTILTSGTNVEAGGVDTDDNTGGVMVKAHPIGAFWLGQGLNGHQKLAFVREVYWDAAINFQGFIADWPKLKEELFAQIEHPVPLADLQPIDVSDETAVYSDAQMENLPVQLVVPAIESTVSTAAWNEVRGTLITTWMAAGIVLVVAGVGLRNLVSLTERRMQFAYAVTHELRTPLTTFRLYSDMLSAGLVPDESKQKYVDTLNRESQRLSSLVEGVLEYARLENQRVKLCRMETEASTLLEEISDHLKKQCDQHGVTPKTENLLANGERIRTDVDVVNRIAGVLVNNACRHARENKDPTVLVRLAGENGCIYLDVADSGPGIDRIDTRAIFKPFRRGRGADKAARGGIGLGLALAKNWATLLGGQLDLFARHHKTLGGAHFRLTIPSQLPS